MILPEIVFRTELTVCPECGSILNVYKTKRRTVKSVDDRFIAIHKLMRCEKHETIFGSDLLHSIIAPGCTYANDVMLESSMLRFIDGRSSSEISREMGNGISGSHVRLLTNAALDIFKQIHEESHPLIRSAMKSYILHIDGTTDSGFEMIMVVRDSISGFTLHAEKCSSESIENMKEVLLRVKERYGIPAGAVSDMRSGILHALEEVFPGMPIRICLFHFLRDLGKDLMQGMHTDLGIAMNRVGIKSTLKSILRSLPDYNQKTLYEIEQGFSSDREGVEIMAIRDILETLLDINGSSGYGFPFSLKHMNFFIACAEAGKKLSDLSAKVRVTGSMALLGRIVKEIRRITSNRKIARIAGMLSGVNMLFQRMRSAFRMPGKGSLSDEIPDDDSIHDRCNIVTGEMEVYLKANIPRHIFMAAKHIISRYKGREAMLFAQNEDGTIPRTNNFMEQFFRKMSRGIRKRCGNIMTGNILAGSGASLALFQNMGNPEYIKIVFGKQDIPAVFAKYRKPFRKPGMTRTTTRKLVEMARKMILTDSLYDTPYNEKLMDSAYASRSITGS
jgi:hypothetical protein